MNQRLSSKSKQFSYYVIKDVYIHKAKDLFVRYALSCTNEKKLLPMVKKMIRIKIYSTTTI